MSRPPQEQPQIRPRTPEERAQIARTAGGLVALAEYLAARDGLAATLDSLMMAWLNLAIVSPGEDWARGALQYALDRQLGEVALGHRDPAGRA